MENLSNRRSGTYPDLNAAISQLKSRTLSSVEFLIDYLQLRFDGPCLTAYTYPIIEHSAGQLSFGELGFRDRLCEQIGVRVADARATEAAVILRLDSGVVISISMRGADQTGPEALQFTAEDGLIWVA
jgi:hypothetical protein